MSGKDRGWSKAVVAKPIDADEYLRRVEQEDAHEVVRAAERITEPRQAGSGDPS